MPNGRPRYTVHPYGKMPVAGKKSLGGHKEREFRKKSWSAGVGGRDSQTSLQTQSGRVRKTQQYMKGGRGRIRGPPPPRLRLHFFVRPTEMEEWLGRL